MWRRPRPTRRSDTGHWWPRSAACRWGPAPPSGCGTRTADPSVRLRGSASTRTRFWRPRVWPPRRSTASGPAAWSEPLVLLGLHPPLGELRAASVLGQADDEEVAVVRLLLIVVRRPPSDEGHVVREGHDLMTEIPPALLVLPVEPALHDLPSRVPRLAVGGGVVPGVLGEQATDLFGVVGGPRADVALHPAIDRFGVHEAPFGSVSEGVATVPARRHRREGANGADRMRSLCDAGDRPVRGLRGELHPGPRGGGGGSQRRGGSGSS